MTLIKSFYLSLGLVAFSINAFCSEKSFDGITCQSNIASTLIGREMPNERVIAIEEKYKNIGLKDLGASGMEIEGDPWTLISWLICKREYVLLMRNNIVKDVLESPESYGSTKSQIVSCAVKGSNLSGTAIIFIQGSNAKEAVPVENVWLIDDSAVKFKKIVGNEIVCK